MKIIFSTVILVAALIAAAKDAQACELSGQRVRAIYLTKSYLDQTGCSQYRILNLPRLITTSYGGAFSGLVPGVQVTLEATEKSSIDIANYTSYQVQNNYFPIEASINGKVVSAAWQASPLTKKWDGTFAYDNSKSVINGESTELVIESGTSQVFDLVLRGRDADTTNVQLTLMSHRIKNIKEDLGSQGDSDWDKALRFNVSEVSSWPQFANAFGNSQTDTEFNVFVEIPNE